MNASSIGQTFRSKQKARLHVPIPHSNLFISSLATSLASQERAKSIILALQQGDTEWYPSAKTGFLESFSSLVSNLESGMRLETPLLAYSKTEIIAFGNALKVDYRTQRFPEIKTVKISMTLENFDDQKSR